VIELCIANFLSGFHPMSDNHDADPEEEHDSSDPLTHFRAHNNSETDLLPAQSPSVCGIVRCSFSHPSGTDVDISLSTDAAPGCGGVAWPAGKVCHHLEEVKRALRVLASFLGACCVSCQSRSRLCEEQDHRRTWQRHRPCGTRRGCSGR
jgi:hypothetical protein